jgi:hypothetical protein
MAIGWLTVLKMVPWRDVISNAPVVADGAKKLWNAVGKKPPASAPSASPVAQMVPESQAVALLQAQIVSLEATTADLHNQMLASSALINALAEQNTQMVKRVEANRIRVLWLAALTIGLGLVVFTQLGLPLFG